MALFRVTYIDVDGDEATETVNDESTGALAALLEDLADSSIDEVKVTYVRKRAKSRRSNNG